MNSIISVNQAGNEILKKQKEKKMDKKMVMLYTKIDGKEKIRFYNEAEKKIHTIENQSLSEFIRDFEKYYSEKPEN